MQRGRPEHRLCGKASSDTKGALSSKEAREVQADHGAEGKSRVTEAKLIIDLTEYYTKSPFYIRRKNSNSYSTREWSLLNPGTRHGARHYCV